MAPPRHFVFMVFCAVFVTVLHAATRESAHDRQERAIGGQGVSRGAYPWLVLLRATIVTTRIFGIAIDHYHLYCGGVLISRQWLLSAAHCFTDHGPIAGRASIWEARMGTSRIRPTIGQRLTDLLGRVIDEDDFRQWEIDVERIVVHPGFVHNSSDIVNDIALVKLERPIPNMDAVAPIAFPGASHASFPSPGSSCITLGWGCTSAGGRPSTYAQQVRMPVLPSISCRRVYGMTSMDGRVCAGYTGRGIGVCMGDSGSPLVCTVPGSTNSSIAVLGGIVSFTSRDNPAMFPAVFTKTQDYVPWIRSVMRRN